MINTQYTLRKKEGQWCLLKKKSTHIKTMYLNVRGENTFIPYPTPLPCRTEV
jgi:hypothetical protein